MGEPQCSTDLTMTEVRPPKFLTGIERFYACARHTRNAGARAGGARCQPDRQTAYGLSMDLAGHPKSILRYHPPLFENTPTGRQPNSEFWKIFELLKNFDFFDLNFIIVFVLWKNHHK